MGRPRDTAAGGETAAHAGRGWTLEDVAEGLSMTRPRAEDSTSTAGDPIVLSAEELEDVVARVLMVEHMRRHLDTMTEKEVA